MGHLVEQRGDHGEWQIHMGTTGVGWVPGCSAYWWLRVDMDMDMDGGQHAGCLDEEGVWEPLWQDVVAHGGEGAYNPQDNAERLALEGAMCETVCPCSGRCKCKAPSPKFQWTRQAKMAECWKYMVPKLTAAGVVDLSCCLSYEHVWQHCGDCRVKVLREGGETGMPAQVLHVTNQGQSVRQRMKEGMKERPVGVPHTPPPLVRVGVTRDRHQCMHLWCSM